MVIEVLNDAKPYLEDLEFRALLTMFMYYDPPPVNSEEDNAIEGLLKHESLVRGYTMQNGSATIGCWVKAFHEFKVGEKND